MEFSLKSKRISLVATCPTELHTAEEINMKNGQAVQIHERKMNVIAAYIQNTI